MQKQGIGKGICRRRITMPLMGKKGSLSEPIFIAFAVVIFLVSALIIYRLFVKEFHGRCVYDLQITVDDIRATVYNAAKNTGDKVTIPVTLGNCVISLVLSNQDTFLQELEKSGTPTEAVFTCPKDYKSRIIGIPFTQKAESGGVVGTVKSIKEGGSAIIDAVANKDFTQLKQWSADAAGFGVKAYCKSLIGSKENLFSNTAILGGGISEDTQKKYCLEIIRTGPATFSINGKSQNELTEEQYSQCKHTPT